MDDLSENKGRFSFKEFTQEFVNLEIEANLLNGTTTISKIWERIRFAVHQEISIKIGIDERSKPAPFIKKDSFITSKLKSTKICKKLSPYFKLFSRNPYFILKKPDIVLFGHARRKKNNDGLYEDIYTDRLISSITNYKTLSIEFPYYGSHMIPELTPNLYYSDFANSIYFLKTKSNKLKLNYLDDDLNKIKETENKILEIFGINIDLKQIFDKAYKKMLIYPDIYRKLLKYLKPKIVIILVSYGKEDLIEAAKSLNIPTIEIQHGVLNNMHMGYCFPPPLVKSTFPDYFFSFGEYWNKASLFPIPDNKIFTFGYPYLTEQINTIDRKKSNIILFLSQPNSSISLTDYAIKIADKYLNNYKIIFKLHPNQYRTWQNDLPKLNEASDKGLIKVIDTDTPTLYQLQAEAIFQIGVNSTALFEGLALKCRTIILKVPGYEYMETLAENNIVRINDHDDLNLENVPEPPDDDNYFFDKNWRNNFSTALESIINKI